jgi:hypothetical protein
MGDRTTAMNFSVAAFTVSQPTTPSNDKLRWFHLHQEGIDRSASFLDSYDVYMTCNRGPTNRCLRGIRPNRRSWSSDKKAIAQGI